jgi:transcriptional regulator with XRE-family HTH domain
MLRRISSMTKTIWKKVRSEKYRRSFVDAHISNTVAAQIAAMREDRKWTQTALAEKAGMKQSRISALEDPDFENVEIATLKRIAAACDVALTVRFVPFSELAIWAGNLDGSMFHVPDFCRDAFAEDVGEASVAPGHFSPYQEIETALLKSSK